jgi:hypothetical protein
MTTPQLVIVIGPVYVESAVPAGTPVVDAFGNPPLIPGLVAVELEPLLDEADVVGLDAFGGLDAPPPAVVELVDGVGLALAELVELVGEVGALLEGELDVTPDVGTKTTSAKNALEVGVDGKAAPPRWTIPATAWMYWLPIVWPLASSSGC